MKLLLISDAWEPQTNGVVTTYRNVIAQLELLGITTEVIHPGKFLRFPCPGYTELKLALNVWKIGSMIQAARADYIHIAVEGPLGIAARRYLCKRGIPYTSAFHTRFPEYIHQRIPLVSERLGYRFMRWFHQSSKTILVTTQTMRCKLTDNGFKRMTIWGRGVDTQLFKPQPSINRNAEHPVFLYVGRLAIEKNIEAFLRLDLPGLKRVVGDGPSRKSLQQKYPEVDFVGYKFGCDLALLYSQADVFVFPSKTDTYGLVMLEAMACGNPVAAFPVEGPIDVVTQGVTGVLNDDLRKAALQALTLDRGHCRKYALQHGWSRIAEVLKANLVPINTYKGPGLA